MGITVSSVQVFSSILLGKLKRIVQLRKYACLKDLQSLLRFLKSELNSPFTRGLIHKGFMGNC